MKRIIFLMMAFSLISCGGPTPKLIPFLKPFKELTIRISDVFYITDVSFLFILDVSGSMGSHTDLLNKNFSVFAPIIEDFSFYNFNFAVTPLGPLSFIDSTFLPVLEVNKESVGECGEYNSFIKKTDDLGPYIRITREDFANHNINDITCVIRSNFVGVHKSRTAYSSYANEFYFHPLDYIMENYDPNGDFKKHFFDQSNFLFIFFISDAQGDEVMANVIAQGADSHEKARIYAEKYWEKLLGKKDGHDPNLIRAFGVIPTEDTPVDRIDKNYVSYDRILPEHTQHFIDLSKGLSFSITDRNWGDNLKEVSNVIEQSLAINNLYLPEIPWRDNMEVYFNEHKLAEGEEDGWIYNPETVSIVFQGSISQYFVKDGDNKFTIKYYPLNPDILYKK